MMASLDWSVSFLDRARRKFRDPENRTESHIAIVRATGIFMYFGISYPLFKAHYALYKKKRILMRTQILLLATYNMALALQLPRVFRFLDLFGSNIACISFLSRAFGLAIANSYTIGVYAASMMLGICCMERIWAVKFPVSYQTASARNRRLMLGYLVATLSFSLPVYCVDFGLRFSTMTGLGCRVSGKGASPWEEAIICRYDKARDAMLKRWIVLGALSLSESLTLFMSTGFVFHFWHKRHSTEFRRRNQRFQPHLGNPYQREKLVSLSLLIEVSIHSASIFLLFLFNAYTFLFSVHESDGVADILKIMILTGFSLQFLSPLATLLALSRSFRREFLGVFPAFVASSKIISAILVFVIPSTTWITLILVAKYALLP